MVDELSRWLVPDELWELAEPLPPSFGATVPTARRRFTVWTKAGLWQHLHRAVLDELGSQGLIDWSRAVIDVASVRVKKTSQGVGCQVAVTGSPVCGDHAVVSL